MADETTEGRRLASNTEALTSNTDALALNTEALASSDTAVEDLLAAKADALLAGVRELREEMSLGTNLETRQSDTEKLVRDQRRTTKWLIASVVLDIALSLGLVGAGFIQRHDEYTLCRATQRSWDTRTRSNELITAPTVLSPQAARLFPASQTESLRLQIEQSNRTRAIQRAELERINGPRPHC